ncbi:MAG: hypothetical protein PVI57_07285 [Gemmatimonadota bacterium]|jgi:hypothetical protein
MRGVRSWLAGALVTLISAGCSDAAASSPLANAERSKEAVARAFFAALEARDAEALGALRVTREEYESLLWPELPDREQMPFEFAWGINQAVSRKGARQAMERYGGARLELVSFEFEKEPEVYPGFTLHRGAKVVARRLDTGETGILPSFDVLVEYAGGWKMMDFDEL